MPLPVILIAAAGVGLLLLARMLTNRAYRHLGQGQRSMLMSQVNQFRKSQFVPFVVVIVAYLVLMDSAILSRFLLTLLSFGGLFVITVVQNVVLIGKLRELRSRPFDREYLISRVIQLVGFGALFSSVVLAVYLQGPA